MSVNFVSPVKICKTLCSISRNGLSTYTNTCTRHCRCSCVYGLCCRSARFQAVHSLTHRDRRLVTKAVHGCSNATLSQQELKQGLYLVATPIGNLSDISMRALDVLRRADTVLAEDSRHSQKLLNYYGIQAHVLSYHQHNEQRRAQQVVSLLQQGQVVALVSDAGMPAISDPGSLLVAAAVAADVAVIPIPGPCAFVSALAASGLDTSCCHFAGFLPPKTAGRQAMLRQLAGMSSTVALYVSPHSLCAVLEDVATVCGADRRLVLARELTKVHEEFLRGTAAELCELHQDRQPRGEYVLLMEGQQPQQPGMAVRKAEGAMQQLDWQTELQELVGGGMKPSAAAKTIARWFGVPRKDVYDAALALAQQQT